MDFANLHVHTSIGSMLDGLASVNDLFDRAKEIGQSAIAITDHGTLAAHYDAFKASKRTGVKFIPGCEVYFVHSYDVLEGARRKRHERRKHLVLLAQNAEGYRNLLKANFESFRHPEMVVGRVFPRMGWDILEAHSEGLICMSACGQGVIADRIMLGDMKGAKEMAARLATIFPGRFYLELQPHHLKVEHIDQEWVNQCLVELAQELNLPLVVTSDTHYLKKGQAYLKDMLGAVRFKRSLKDEVKDGGLIDEFYLKSGDEVHGFLNEHYTSEVADEATLNTIRIADKCENATYLKPKGHHLPIFPVKDEPDYEEFLEWRKADKSSAGLNEDAAFMRFRSFKGFKKRFAGFPPDALKQRWDRVRHEVNILERNDFSSYMLVVSDFIRWAKANGIMVGPGRGCLDGNTLVLTEKGFCFLCDVRRGDRVFTHTGKLRKVLGSFRYDTDEEMVEVKTDFSWLPIRLTKDHKVFGCSANRTRKGEAFVKTGAYSKSRAWESFGHPDWLEAGKLKCGDGLFIPWPEKPQGEFPEYFDMAQWARDDARIFEDRIEYSVCSKHDNLSLRTVSKRIGCSRNTLKRVKSGSFCNVDILGRKASRFQSAMKRLQDYLEEFGMSVSEWVNYDAQNVRSIIRRVSLNSDVAYMIGRWIGDGWIGVTTGTQGYRVGFAFHGDDTVGLNRIRSLFQSLGFDYGIHRHKKKNLKQFVIYDKLLYRFFKHLIPDYNQRAQTKHMPCWFRNLPSELMGSILDGLRDSDGSVENSRFCVDTTSIRLAKEMREMAWFLRIPSSTQTRLGRFDERLGYWCSDSYKVRFYPMRGGGGRGIQDRDSRLVGDGFYVRVQSVNPIYCSKVFDIKVEEDESYLTSEYAVHNSVGGSLVAYLLDIHMVDPLPYGLLFERFQNAEKKDLPDVDTDFASAGLEDVKEYVRQKYGHDNCAQVSNIITYSPKTAISDLARSLRIGDDSEDGKNYFQIAAEIKNSIPDQDAEGNSISTIEQALEASPKLREFAQTYPDLIRYAKTFVGLEKEFGTHAAGMAVCDIPIYDFAPLRIDKHGAVAVQAEKEQCEERGLVKMDFLGLSTLDVIDEALKNIKKLGMDGPTCLEDIPLDDKPTYEMISQGLTRCVFQLGKNTMAMALCRRVKPKNIIDIAVVNALIRPSSGLRKLPDGSTYDERSEYIGRRNGEKAITYLHPSLRCLEETLGLCIMEEQLMGVAGHCAGWDLNKADKLRKFTKLKGKKPELAAQLQKDFIQGVMETQGVDEELATTIWKQIVEGFGGYGFNRSHAVFYSINGYYTAYLKCHHPAAFLAAKLKVETRKNSVTSSDEIDFAKQECRRLGIKIMPPDINRSSAGYEVTDNKTIVMGLGAVKGMGDKAVADIEKKQPFSSFPDFIHRIESRVVNKGKIEALAKAGCFDSFKLSRKFVHDENVPVRERLRRVMSKLEKDGYDTDTALSQFSLGSYPDEWDRKTLLEHESAVIGQCLSGSLNEIYNGFFTGINTTLISQLKRLPDRHPIVVEVLVKSALREFTIKKKGRNFGRKMIKYAVEDIHGDATELTVWPNMYAMAKKVLKDGTPIRATCQVSDFNGQKTIMLMNFQQIYGVKNDKQQQQQQKW